MPKKNYNFRLDTDVMESVERLAAATGMDGPDYLRLWLGRIANLKTDYALDALTSIPKDYFKSHGGRPSIRPATQQGIDSPPATEPALTR